MKIKIISQKEVAKAVSMAEAIRAVRNSYIQLSEGKAGVPLRSHLEVTKTKGTALFMPGYLSESDALGVKTVTVFPDNPKRKLPTIYATILVLDTETGQPLALIEGTYLTALRTGAASGVATDLLARREARVAAVFGAGVQARTQLEAVCTVRPIEKVWVYDIKRKKAEKFAQEMRNKESLPSDVSAASTPSQAVSEADIICTATTSFNPVFDDKDLKPGVHINGIGSYAPEMTEIPAPTVARARVVVDSIKAALSEAGDLIVPLRKGLISEDHIQAEIGEVAAGKKKVREGTQEITFFKSVGIAVQDVAVAELVLRRSMDLKLGVEVEI
ncbi:MAG: ornithine cyclodeaminase family protein [Candidatus Aminicenantes bacterium]